MPAAKTLAAGNGTIEIWPLLYDALGAALVTAVGAGQCAKILTMSAHYFRPARAAMGNLVARARVLNASSLFTYAEVLIEDNEGRQIAHGVGDAAIVTKDPPPPAPPMTIEPIEQPTWATLDPWQRPAGATVPQHVWDETDGKDVIHRTAVGTWPSPISSLLGYVIEEADETRLVATTSASEWFCCDERRIVSGGVLAAFANQTGFTFGMRDRRPGDSLVGLDAVQRFFGQIVADGRPIRAEARRRFIEDDVTVMETAVSDADGHVALVATGSAVHVDSKRRGRTRRRASERVLCTILFTDIVDSTTQAETLGDAAWHALLERHNEVARLEIARHGGIEVKTTGDGLLVRFGSPARALDCAIRLRDELAGLGLQIRAGLHAGECEIADDDIIGVAVHLAARIQSTAASGEVLVSSTVKDLTAGSLHRFENRGEHRLKGVEDPWCLWAVG